MQCYFELKQQVNNTAVALGFFDGLHRGHLSVIEPAAQQSKNGLTSVCLTFGKSPKAVISGMDTPMLMTHGDKIKALEGLGIDKTFFIDFQSVKELGAQEFFDRVICETLSAKKLYCGFNYRFGKNAAGDVELLKELCKEKGIELFVAPPFKIGSEVVCSSLIKQKIADGRVSEANLMLGSLFGFSAPVLHGKRLGRELGTPTINQAVQKGLILPKFGVYASVITLESGERFCGVTNVGIKPTVGGEKPLYETWMPKYRGGEIYGQTADIRLLDFIRAEKRFDSLNDLKREIFLNSKVALSIYEKHEKHNA